MGVRRFFTGVFKYDIGNVSFDHKYHTNAKRRMLYLLPCFVNFNFSAAFTGISRRLSRMEFQQANPHATLQDYLESVSLDNDVDNDDGGVKN